MHLRLVRPVAAPAPQRPAKVVALDVRRQARLEAAPKERQPQHPRPAA
jgi:hypothetical protein